MGKKKCLYAFHLAGIYELYTHVVVIKGLQAVLDKRDLDMMALYKYDGYMGPLEPTHVYEYVINKMRPLRIYEEIMFLTNKRQSANRYAAPSIPLMRGRKVRFPAPA